jgi:lipid-binding SYLF domain-containing protein
LNSFRGKKKKVISKRESREIKPRHIIIDNGKGVDSIIDPHILADAKGLAIFTVLKAGFLFSGRAGSGLVIAR